jgi:carbon monoxide dehydrogenase subunit G
MMIRTEFPVAASPDDAWAAIRDVGNVHTRLARGFVTDCRLDGDVRTVTFANGTVVDELIVSVDDAARRVAYSARGGQAQHHHASLEVLDADGAGARLLWTTDVLPDGVGAGIAAMVEAGSQAIAATVSG